MAALSAELLKQGKSVLVTALTNQALIELAKKKDLKEFLEAHKVTKTSLTVDESKEVPKLQSNSKNVCNAAPGNLSLATFYLSSTWAKETIEIPFDYVIMDEASQALYPMIAASMKLGRKIIWIGDQNQLPPIVITGEDVINRYNWGAIVKGFNTLCTNFSYPSYMLKDTFRLTERGAACTGIFYNNDLNSVSEVQTIKSSIECMNRNGGPTFWGMELAPGDKTPSLAINSIIDLVEKILSEDNESKIAVLSKFRPTIRQIQKQFILQSKKSEIPENVKIETVDRVQGLTVDYCIFFIPNASLKYSLEKELFNVATSRAQYCTIIVADKSLMGKDMEEEVRKYLLKCQDDKFVEFNGTKNITAGNVSFNVLGKIDLSKFEKKRKEIVDGKDNIYIIDTNVFVNCPNIIDKIGHKYKVIIPAKVLEELDKLKLKNNIDKNALNTAAKNINIAFTKQFSKMEEANISLLPVGFDKNNPDCQILSVALKYKGENPIILTSDNILQTRANGLGITTISLTDFLRQLR
jgi:rRNA-processing protein FCF1